MELLVAVDGSEQSERTLREAAAAADSCGGSLVLVHVVEPEVRETPPEERGDDRERALVRESPDEAADRGQRILDDATGIADEAGVDYESELLDGDPTTAIVDFAAERGVDGIYVGHRRLGEEYERVLGSVAKELIETAPVPVTVVGSSVGERE